MGVPSLLSNIYVFVPEVLKLAVSDNGQYRVVRAGLFDRQELYWIRTVQIAFRLPRQAAKRERRDGPQETVWKLHWDAQVDSLIGIACAR